MKLLDVMGTSTKNEEEKRCSLHKWTPAQAAFEKMQEKWQMEDAGEAANPEESI